MTEVPEIPGAVTDVELVGRLYGALARLSRRARQYAPYELTASKVSALTALEVMGPVRMVDLAAQEGISVPTQSRLIAHLESLGLVTRTPDPADGRASLLTLTDVGHARLAQLRADRAAFLQSRISALPEEQRAALTAALPVLEILAAP